MPVTWRLPQAASNRRYESVSAPTAAGLETRAVARFAQLAAAEPTLRIVDWELAADGDLFVATFSLALPEDCPAGGDPLTDFWLLDGRPGGQVGNGGIGPGENATIQSTADPVKGTIFLGIDPTEKIATSGPLWLNNAPLGGVGPGDLNVRDGFEAKVDNAGTFDTWASITAGGDYYFGDPATNAFIVRHAPGVPTPSLGGITGGAFQFSLTAGKFSVGPSASTSAAAGSTIGLRLDNSAWLQSLNAAGSGWIYSVGTDASNNVWIGNVSGGAYLKCPPLGVLEASATIKMTTLLASSGVYTDASKNLTNTAPTSGALGYWQRVGTAIAPATLTDSLGIGTTAPGGLLHLQGTNNHLIWAESSATLQLTKLDAVSAGNGIPINLRRARGTLAAPAATLNGDALGFFQGGGYDGATFTINSGMRVYASENFTGGAQGTNIRWMNTPIGSSTITEMMRLEGALLGIGTVAPTSTLDVNGAAGSSQLRLRTSFTPGSSADAAGQVGQVAWDASWIYIKTAAGWKRSSILVF